MKRLGHPLNPGDSATVLGAHGRLGAGSHSATAIATEANLDRDIVIAVLIGLERKRRVRRRSDHRYSACPEPLEGWGLWGGQGRMPT